MGSFRRNQIPRDPNPWVARQGQLDWAASFLGAGFYGLGTIGAMNPHQANVVSDGEHEEPGHATVWPQVIDWPFAADDAGCSYDQDNLYGVRTRCIRNPIADGGGDDDYWLAVPKVLPEGYTSVGRCSLIAPMFVDHFGDDPFNTPPLWNHRTHSGYLLDHSTDEGAARAKWGPRAFNQQVYSISAGWPSGWTSVIAAPDPDDSLRQAIVSSDHIGYRQVKIEATISNPRVSTGGAQTSVNRTLNLYSAPMTDPVWTSVASPPPGKVTHGSISISHSFGVGEGPFVQNFTISNALATPTGVVHRFYLVTDSGTGGAGEDLVFIGITMQLSPRTDVPPWFFISSRNKCAPGGIISP